MEPGCSPKDFSIPYDDADLSATIAYAQGRGAVCIAAAGNHSPNFPFYNIFGGPLDPNCDPVQIPYTVWPAAYAGVIGVSATDSLDRFYDYDTYGSYNYGSFVSLAAPGVNIWHPYGPPTGYAVHTGTSFSSPETAALVGLLLSISPALTSSQVTRGMFQS